MQQPIAGEAEIFVTYTENFLTNHLVTEIWKLVYICQSYYQTSSCFLFGTQCIFDTTLVRVNTRDGNQTEP